MELATIIVSIIALFSSIINVVFYARNERKGFRIGTLSGVYDSFHELGVLRMNNPLFTYLFETPDNYEKIIKDCSFICLNKDEEYLVLKKLEERSLALLIFNFYEDIIFKKLSIKDTDIERQKFVDAVLNYFTRYLLRNPRLLYLWSADGGNLASFFEEVTVDNYNKNVREEMGETIEKRMDKTGPFPKNIEIFLENEGH